MNKLAEFRRQTATPIEQNASLFRWLSDDAARAEFYTELRNAGYPTLQFKSVMRTDDVAAWPSLDVYFVTKPNDAHTILRTYSVEPYATLDSGGRFMLGLDDPGSHMQQKRWAHDALKFEPSELAATARLAVRRAMVLPMKNSRFDLVTDVAKQAALRYVQLLFGMPRETHVLLELAMQSAYQRLSFQIIGRHFVSESGLQPRDLPDAKKAREELRRDVLQAADNRNEQEGLPKMPIIARLYHDAKLPDDDLVVVALGLMAGTVGNITAAISIALDQLLTRANGMFDLAVVAARNRESNDLASLITAVLVPHPPAPFLARRVPEGGSFGMVDRDGRPLPAGALVLLALGANSASCLHFGGPWADPRYPHQCVGKRLVAPIVVEAVRAVLRLPGLARDIEPTTGQPAKLTKRWGAMCTAFPLWFRRDRLVNQQPLHVVLPVKEPVAINGPRLAILTRAGANIVEEALDGAPNVHFAWFNLSKDMRFLTMCTVYDGDFDTYVEHFALDVPLFDRQFEYLDVKLPPGPIRLHPKAFVDAIREHNMAPVAGYFYSAYTDSVADLRNRPSE